MFVRRHLGSCISAITLTNRKVSIAGCIAALVIGSTSIDVYASSHREAPYITKNPQVDATDFYMFNSYEEGREGYVTLLANYIPVQAAYGGPNYFPLDPNALYEIHIDSDGDALEDIGFQFDFSLETPDSGVPEFTVGAGENQKSIPSVLKNVGAVSADSSPGLSHLESFRLKVVRDRYTNLHREFITNSATGSRQFAKPFDYAGTKTFGGAGAYADYADSFIHNIDIPGCDSTGRVFVGQRLESFKISLGETFDLINLVPIEGDSAPGAGDGGGFPGGITQDPERNDLQRNNVTTIALELPRHCVTGNGNGVIGAWTSASLRQVSIVNPYPTLDRPEINGGSWTRVSRLGSPLVNELFIGFPDKDRFNTSRPDGDARFADYVTHPVFPEIVNALFRDAVNTTLGADIASLAPSNIPRHDLVAGFLTGFPGLNQLAKVTPSEMLRLNTGVPAVGRAEQHPLGVAAGDVAGFPNGRRPGDDVVDIALRVAMGVLCHPVPLGAEGAFVNLGLCAPGDAPVGAVPLTDGAPIDATEFENQFPYLLSPYPGSPNNAPIPEPRS